MGEIRFTSNVKKEHYKNMAFYNLYVRKPHITIMSIVMIVLGILLIIFLEKDFLRWAINILLIVYPFVLLFTQIRRINKMVAEKKIPDTEAIVTIFNDDRGITTTMDGEARTFDWSEVFEFHETSALFCAYTTANRIIYMPKADIDPEYFNQIRNVVRNKLSHKAYKLKN